VEPFLLRENTFLRRSEMVPKLEMPCRIEEEVSQTVVLYPQSFFQIK
jgi:hypothetical protein